MISDAAITELKLRNPCDEVARRWVTLRAKGKKWIGPCPLHSPDPHARDSTSFECDAEGWVCATCHNGGDQIKLVALYHGLDPKADFVEVVKLLGDVVEPDPERARELDAEKKLRGEQREKEANDYRERERRTAFSIWKAGENWRGTPVEEYLRRCRGLAVLPEHMRIRFAPRVAYFDGEEINELGRKAPRVVHVGPAMLAPIVDGAGYFRAVHMRWLDLAQPNGKARIVNPDDPAGEPLDSTKVRGSKRGNVIILAEPSSAAVPRSEGSPESAEPAVSSKGRVFAGEGIETVLSAYAALALDGRDLGRDWFLATVDMGNLAGVALESVRHPTLKDKGKRARRFPGPLPKLDDPGFALPADAGDVILLGDGDSDPFVTQCAHARAALRLEHLGHAARTAWAVDGKDFNDMLRDGVAIMIVAAIDAAARVEAPIAAPSTNSPAAADHGDQVEGASAESALIGKDELVGADNILPFPGKNKRKGGKRKAAKDGDPPDERVTGEAGRGAGDVDDEGKPPAPRQFGFSVDNLNREYALVLMGSKAVVYFERPSAALEDQKRMLTIEAFGAWFANRFTERFNAQGDIVVVTWAKAWLQSRDRRQYHGVEFYPDPDNEGGTPGYLNLWSGFAFKPASRPDPLRYKTFRDHLLNNVCGGDDRLYAWVFGFFAHIVQRPRERLGVALVLRGGMGSGKTIVGKLIGALFPTHYFLVDDPRYVTGQFNAHMASCLLLQADEAVWAGDKAAEGRLKGLITSEIQQIEAKGIDPIRLANYVRLLMTSNEDWVVPAGKDERRFAVLDVDPRCAQQHGYFREMEAELANGGFEHLLGALLRFDLDSVDLRQVPRTDALLEQKLRSLGSVESWWYGRLAAGTPTHAHSEWKTEVPSHSLFGDYIVTSEKIGVRRKQEETIFGLQLRRLVPELGQTRPLMEVEGEGGRFKRERVRCYVLPELAVARADFERLVQQPIVRPADDPPARGIESPANEPADAVEGL